MRSWKPTCYLPFLFYPKGSRSRVCLFPLLHRHRFGGRRLGREGDREGELIRAFWHKLQHLPVHWGASAGGGGGLFFFFTYVCWGLLAFSRTNQLFQALSPLLFFFIFLPFCFSPCCSKSKSVNVMQWKATSMFLFYLSSGGTSLGISKALSETYLLLHCTGWNACPGSSTFIHVCEF